MVSCFFLSYNLHIKKCTDLKCLVSFANVHTQLIQTLKQSTQDLEYYYHFKMFPKAPQVFAVPSPAAPANASAPCRGRVSLCLAQCQVWAG